LPRLNPSALAAFAAAALLQGCTASDVGTTQVQFYGPAGLAVAPAPDRDLLFIASTGGDDLRAITMCNTPSPDDGGAPVTTCTDAEDFHFLPGPLRVFPGSFPTGNRPVRLASINLRDSAGNVQGGVLVAGVAALVDSDGGILDGGQADAGTVTAVPALELVDAVNLLAATKHTAVMKVPSNIPLDTPPIDVVSLQYNTGTTPASGATQPAFVLTEANVESGIPAEISALTLSTSADGPVAAVVGRCSLDILATRLALIPGQSDLLYVADATVNAVAGGVGDGAIEILTSTIPPLSAGTVAPCTINRRLPATDPSTGLPRGLTSLALSPAYSIPADNRYYPAGAQMLGVSTDGFVVFIRTDLGVLSPIPPFTPLGDGGTNIGVIDGLTAFVQPDGGVAPVLADGGFGDSFPGVSMQPMEPLRVNGLAREVAYMQTPLTCPANTAPGTPCEYIRAGASTNSFLTADFPLVGLVTSTDGSVVFIDGDDRRFVNDLRDAISNSTGTQPTVDTSYTFSPAQPNGQAAPVLTFAPTDGTHVNLGWVTAGVSRQTAWRAVWHAQVPGLERQGGTLTREGASQLRFTMPGVDLSRWTNPALNDPIGVGDVVAFEAYSLPDPTQTLCAPLTAENLDPLSREFSIAAIGDDYFILNPSTQGVDVDGGPGFNPPDDCLPVGATVEVRTGAGLGNEPWLILEGDLIHGRAATNTMFVATETRFDYPLQYVFDPTDLSSLPTVATDIGVAFTITGTEPVTAQSTLSWSVTSGQSPTRVSDTGNPGGFAGAVITYTSLKIPGNLVFVSSTGSNSLLQIDPSLIGITNGVIAYR